MMFSEGNPWALMAKLFGKEILLVSSINGNFVKANRGLLQGAIEKIKSGVEYKNIKKIFEVLKKKAGLAHSNTQKSTITVNPKDDSIVSASSQRNLTDVNSVADLLKLSILGHNFKLENKMFEEIRDMIHVSIQHLDDLQLHHFTAWLKLARLPNTNGLNYYYLYYTIDSFVFEAVSCSLIDNKLINILGPRITESSLQ